MVAANEDNHDPTMAELDGNSTAVLLPSPNYTFHYTPNAYKHLAYDPNTLGHQPSSRELTMSNNIQAAQPSELDCEQNEPTGVIAVQYSKLIITPQRISRRTKL
jgi:hypothetical protein